MFPVLFIFSAHSKIDGIADCEYSPVRELYSLYFPVCFSCAFSLVIKGASLVGVSLACVRAPAAPRAPGLGPRVPGTVDGAAWRGAGLRRRRGFASVLFVVSVSRFRAACCPGHARPRFEGFNLAPIAAGGMHYGVQSPGSHSGGPASASGGVGCIPALAACPVLPWAVASSDVRWPLPLGLRS